MPVDGANLHGGLRIDALGLEYVGKALVGGIGEGDMIPAEMGTGATIDLPGMVMTE